MDPLQKKRTDSYQELMVWIQMLLHPLEIGIYTNNYSATALIRMDCLLQSWKAFE